MTKEMKFDFTKQNKRKCKIGYIEGELKEIEFYKGQSLKLGLIYFCQIDGKNIDLLRHWIATDKYEEINLNDELIEGETYFIVGDYK